MKIEDVSRGEVSVVELAPAAAADFGASIPLRAEAALQFSEAAGDAFLRVGDTAFPVVGRDSRASAALARLRDRNLPRLCWIARVDPKSGTSSAVLVQAHEFPAQHHWSDRVDIGVDDKVVAHLRQKQSRMQSVSEVVSWLTERFILPATGGSPTVRVLLSGSPDAAREPKKAFRLHGRGYCADIQRGAGDKLTVVRVVEAHRETSIDERRPVVLVHAHVRFCDATVAGAFRGSARSQLDQLVEKAGSYLNVWKEYNRLERDSILRRARALGWLRYSSSQIQPDGQWRFRLDESNRLQAAFDILHTAEEIELEAAVVPPPELQGTDAAPAAAPPAGARGRERSFVGAYAGGDLERRFLDIQPPVGLLEDREPPPEGVLFVSLSGDWKRLERREHAQSLIASAECPMPQLGLLLEGSAVPERRRKAEKALSAAAREVFGGEPTARQIKALDIALNTPDIALIQGPPGTGKTKTIAALQARLAEVSENAEVAGLTLLTSYQHDAVENAASRTMVFGLPAIKVGRKRGEPEDKDGFDRWRRDRVDAVRARLATLPERPISEVLRRVRAMAASYIASPRSADESPRLLKDVAELADPFLPPALKDRILSLAYQLGRSATPLDTAAEEDRALALKAVRALRVEPVSFGDDGPRSALRLQRRLELLGEKDERALRLLEDAAAWEGEEAPTFLGELRRLQEELLDRLSSEKPGGPPPVHADLEALLSEIVDALYRKARESTGGEDAVLYEYLNDLENDVEGVRAAVQDYTVVLAATCQQAVGYQMTLTKGNDTVFENVIVDEAARANPLDLFIPMSRAERRIVLVGDHRQLPHILEPDIEAQLELSVSEATRSALRRSLFERLILAMRKRESADGIPRTVTLDVQYRMHPVLGAFVSDTFYEPHGERFSSGRPAEDFRHDLAPYAGRVAAWVDIPLSAGREKGGQSKRRPAEARWVAKEVQRLATARHDFSFGVISFYAAQIEEILREMEPLGLSERLDDGSLRVAGAWRETRGPDGRLRERLRVGTVDAFQGKEFDVVILSMTRSNDLPDADERARRRKYGHLMLENRLCVAMSRQQRLLVVAGDAGMLRGKGADEAVHGLVAFQQLCRGSHGLILPA